MLDHETKALLEEQTGFCLNQIEQGISLSKVAENIKANLEAIGTDTKLRVVHVLSHAACNYFESNRPIFDSIVDELEGKKDVFLFIGFVAKLRNSGEFERAWDFLCNTEVFSPEELAKQKSITAERITNCAGGHEKIDSLLAQYPNDDILQAYRIIREAKFLKGRNKMPEALAVIDTIDPKDESNVQPLAWTLLRSKFTQKARNLVHSTTTIQRPTVVAMAREILKLKLPTEAVEMIKPIICDDIAPAVENDGEVIGFQLDALSLYADCARRDTTLAAGFLEFVTHHYKAGNIPEPVCRGVIKYFQTGKKTEGKLSAKPSKEKKDATTRSKFFQDPHKILRSEPLNRTASNVIEQDLRRDREN